MNWEYKTAEIKLKLKGMFGSYYETEELQTALNEWGRQGWEVVNCQFPVRAISTPRAQVVMKRPKS